MGTLPMIRWLLVLGCLLPMAVWAGPDMDKPAEADAEEEEVVEDIAANKKKRAGSYILGNRGLSRRPDLRGDFERRRDQEVLKHFTRTAQLDAIARRAKIAAATDILTRIDRIRRIESARHRIVMKEIRDGALYGQVGGAR